jgi:hypothetical protein
MAGTCSGIVVGRPSVLTNGRARIAAASFASPDLAALLGLHLLGAKIEPVFGLAEPAAARSAFAQGAVDAVLLGGHDVSKQFDALTAAGAQALFTLGAVDEAGKIARDPTFPAVPHFAELYGTRTGKEPSGLLFEAWSAAAAAAQLEFGLVLQHLTPAAMVAIWRRAGADAPATLGVHATAANVGVRPLAGPAATTNTAALAVTTPALEELRRWLTGRFNWRPA